MIFMSILLRAQLSVSLIKYFLFKAGQGNSKQALSNEEDLKVKINWHEGAVFQRSSFGRSTAGNDVVASILTLLLLGEE